MSRYGIMAVNDQATTQSGITSTPTKLENLGASSYGSGIETVTDDNKLVIRVPGPHVVFAQVSFQKEEDDDQDNYHIFLYRNGLNTGYGFARNLKTSSTDLGSGSFYGLMNLEVNDVLELFMFTDEAGPSTITIVDAQFGAVSL